MIVLWEQPGCDDALGGHDTRSGVEALYTSSDSWLVGGLSSRAVSR